MLDQIKEIITNYVEVNPEEITEESELPVKYDGNLLAFNLGFENYEFYYDTQGAFYESAVSILVSGSQTALWTPG